MLDLATTFGEQGAAGLLALAIAFLATALLTRPVRQLAVRIGAVDLPGGRRIHQRPTPRIGGIGLLLGVAIAVVAVLAATDFIAEPTDQLVAILGATGVVFLVGFYDDACGLRPAHKLLGLTAAGVLLMACGVRIDVIALAGVGTIDLGWLAFPLTLLWLLACTNAVNLIDGVDGASSGIVMIAAAILGLVALGVGDPLAALVFFAVCGGCGGFLVYNREPASIFLGDCGALPLGFLLAATSTQCNAKRATAMLLVAALLVLAVPFVDTTQSIWRRLRGAWSLGGAKRLGPALRAIATADRQHIHHRLLLRGLSHREIARTLSMVTAVLGLSALLLLPTGRRQVTTLVASIAVGAWMLVRVARVAPIDQAQAGDKRVILPRPSAVLRPERQRTASRSIEAPAEPTADEQAADEPAVQPDSERVVASDGGRP